MQVEKTLELRKAWGNRPCDHPDLAKEYDRGAATGDYVCTRCGEAGWGNSWNRPTQAPGASEPKT
jgi:hypothetical protein